MSRRIANWIRKQRDKIGVRILTMNPEFHVMVLIAIGAAMVGGVYVDAVENSVHRSDRLLACLFFILGIWGYMPVSERANECWRQARNQQPAEVRKTVSGIAKAMNVDQPVLKMTFNSALTALLLFIAGSIILVDPRFLNHSISAATAQMIANALLLTCLYSLVGLGFGLVYTVSRFFHFAHGALFAVAAYAGYALLNWGGLSSFVSSVGAICIAIAIVCLLHMVVYRPLLNRGSSPLALLIASLGVFICIEAGLAILFGSDVLVFKRYSDQQVVTIAGQD